MNDRDWKPLYQRILRDFGHMESRDEESARMLDALLPTGRELAEDSLGRMKGARVTVLGPALTGFHPRSLAGPLVVADSAVSLLEDGVVPLAVVTDLDGDVEIIARLSAAGSVIVVHAHGDNQDRLDAVRKFKGPALGTCQCAPMGNLRNFGGFTDGDRSAFLAEAFGASSIDLVGFDFENPARKGGVYSDIKRRKLAWAKKLLRLVKIPVTMGGEPLV
ncbi:MAG: 6-hydroxymethylpterin diphosphokinase MptE-like protein [Methanobacteriota archaeon]